MIKLLRKSIKLTIKIAISQSGITPLLRSFLRLRRLLRSRWGDAPATASPGGYVRCGHFYHHGYRIIRIDGSTIHVRCSPRLGGELLCAPKQLRHYHSPDDLSWDEWRLSDSEVERIDLENSASPEEADELEETTADEMAVDGYYVVAGIARHEYKQGWKFLTLWDGYGLSEATWEPMSAFI